MTTLTYCHAHGTAHDATPDERPCRTEEWTVVPGTVVGSIEIDETELPGCFVLKAGDLAYLDAFSALVPVKVLAVNEWGQVKVQVTAPRQGWTRGEYVTLEHPGLSLVARTQVSTRRGQYRIAGRVRLFTDSGVLLP